jgi:NSS family neurotransmitter:Na+ symporter
MDLEIRFILAAAGSAVGLGNTGSFPISLVSTAARFFICLSDLCISYRTAVIIAEIIMGLMPGKNPVGSFKQLSKGKPFWVGIGFLGITTGFIIYLLQYNCRLVPRIYRRIR